MSEPTNIRSFRGFLPGMSIGVTIMVLLGCGTVGPPLPPEQIGIEAKIRQQRAQEDSDRSTQEKIIPIGEGEVVLPPLQPVGIP